MNFSRKKMYEELWLVVEDMKKEVPNWWAGLAKEQASQRRLAVELETLCNCLQAEEMAKAEPEQLVRLAPSLTVRSPRKSRLVVAESMIEFARQMVKTKKEEDLRSSLLALLGLFFFGQDKSVEDWFFVLLHGLDQLEKSLPALANRFKLAPSQVEAFRAWIQLKRL